LLVLGGLLHDGLLVDAGPWVYESDHVP
jgi:hypothetical protein